MYQHYKDATQYMNVLKSAKRAASSIVATVMPIRWKEYNEMRYWKQRKKNENVLSNDHYKHFYTAHFSLHETFYEGKTIVDIGCGPRGSLEWASMAHQRIGLDPLASEYLKLGASEHNMEYIDSPSENIPLEDESCDAVFSFNSLDHVESIEKTISEIKRIVKPGGMFLLIVEINHPPTSCEPHVIVPAELLESLKPEFHFELLKAHKPVVNGAYQSILEDSQISDPENTTEIGYLSGKFTRV